MKTETYFCSLSPGQSWPQGRSVDLIARWREGERLRRRKEGKKKERGREGKREGNGVVLNYSGAPSEGSTTSYAPLD